MPSRNASLSKLRCVGIHPRGGPRDAIVHAEQPGCVRRDPGVDVSPLTDPARSVALGERFGGVEELAETPRLFPSPGRRVHTGLGEQLLVVEQIVSRPLLWKGVLTAVERESLVQRRNAVCLQRRSESLVLGQHAVEVQQHSPVGQSGIGQIPRHQHVRTFPACAIDRHVLQGVRSGQQRPNLDIGIPALKGIDNPQPGVRLFGIGREEEGQCIVIRTAPGRPQRQRRGAKCAGAT